MPIESRRSIDVSTITTPSKDGGSRERDVGDRGIVGKPAQEIEVFKASGDQRPPSPKEVYHRRLAELPQVWDSMGRDALAEHFGVTPQTISRNATELREQGVPLAEKRGRYGKGNRDPRTLERLAFIESNMTMPIKNIQEALDVSENVAISLRTELKEKLGIPKTSVGKPPEKRIAERREKEHTLIGAGFSVKETAALLGISHTRVRNGVQLLTPEQRADLGIKPGKKHPNEIDWRKRAAAVEALHLPFPLAAERLGVPIEIFPHPENRKE